MLNFAKVGGAAAPSAPPPVHASLPFYVSAPVEFKETWSGLCNLAVVGRYCSLFCIVQNLLNAVEFVVK